MIEKHKEFYMYKVTKYKPVPIVDAWFDSALDNLLSTLDYEYGGNNPPTNGYQGMTKECQKLWDKFKNQLKNDYPVGEYEADEEIGAADSLNELHDVVVLLIEDKEALNDN